MDEKKEIIINNTYVDPETPVIHASTPLGGDSLYGTWGYKYATVDEAIEILMRDFDVDEETARNCVQIITAEEAFDSGIANFCRIADEDAL